MIDHIVIGVSDYEKSKQFYRAVLEPIGYKLLMEIEGWAGFGADKAEFWFNQVANPGTAYHFAFSSPDRKAVDEFYHAALQAGGRDNGPPGVREIYHPDYYGAFVFDPDGNNIEAVCHKPA